MNRDNDQSSDDALRARIETLQRALKAGENPPGFGRLLAFLASGENDPSIEPPAGELAADGEDDMMLAVLISEALADVDIAQRYPRYFKRMLVDAELRTAFLDGLAALEETADETFEPLPLPPSRDLTFLRRRVRRPTAPDGARDLLPIQWRRSAKEVANALSVFLFPGAQPGMLAEAGLVYRSDDEFLDDDSTILLRGRLVARNVEFDVTLVGERRAAHPDELRLTLWVVPVDETQAPARDLALVAAVEWGDYEAEVDISAEGHYALPPRKLHEVAGQSQNAAGDLHITLRHKQ